MHLITCSGCGELKVSFAMGFCKPCYFVAYYRKNREKINAYQRQRRKMAREAKQAGKRE